jgi:hypothetical protein
LDVATGNFPTVTRVLLAKIPPEDGKMTYVYDNHVFHYVVENSICYLCMSDELNKHRIPYAFLQDMKERFLAQYGHEAPLTAHAFCYNDEFSRTLQERMDYYNSDEADKAIDNIGSVKSQIDEVKGIMVQNIEKVRGWNGIIDCACVGKGKVAISADVCISRTNYDCHILIPRSWSAVKRLNSSWTRRIV